MPPGGQLPDIRHSKAGAVTADFGSSKRFQVFRKINRLELQLRLSWYAAILHARRTGGVSLRAGWRSGRGRRGPTGAGLEYGLLHDRKPDTHHRRELRDP